MYCLAWSRVGPLSLRRYSKTSFADGDLSLPPNFGPSAVQTVASKPLASAQIGKSGMPAGAASPRCHDPIRGDQFLTLMSSRFRSASLASGRLAGSICAHRILTGVARRSITRVMRPSDDCRVNSTGANGPSSNHLRRMGRSRGSQTSDPQPRQAILTVCLSRDRPFSS